MNYVIGLSGLAGSGKDTAASYLCEMGYEQYSLAWPIKDFFDELHGWNMRHREGDLKETQLEVEFSTSRFYEVLMEQFSDYLLGVDDKRPALCGGITVYDLAEKWLDILQERGCLQKRGQVNLVRYSPRQAYQYFGTDLMRTHVRQTIWIDLAQHFVSENQRVVIPDVRFNNEAAFIHDNMGLILRIERQGVRAVNAHVSEAGLSPDNIDILVSNNGTLEQFETEIRSIVTSLESKARSKVSLGAI